jgi:ribonuclease VapC
MILDTSAVMAILSDEDDAAQYARLIREARGGIAMSAATLVELTMVAESRGGPAMGPRVDALLRHVGVEVVELDAAQAQWACDGWRRFGKGRHPARLNLGDCFAYALARQRGEPLLFKGEDFAQTDVKRAL